ncbi:hypothetical protein T492DRAFT_843178 [Pavlovales sp. CCMP2436]|nr:hypothetical protein T492DRAFT_843178 [Pavlovales sp. CCMP2436]
MRKPRSRASVDGSASSEQVTALQASLQHVVDESHASAAELEGARLELEGARQEIALLAAELAGTRAELSAQLRATDAQRAEADSLRRRAERAERAVQTERLLRQPLGASEPALSEPGSPSGTGPYSEPGPSSKPGASSDANTQVILLLLRAECGAADRLCSALAESHSRERSSANKLREASVTLADLSVTHKAAGKGSISSPAGTPTAGGGLLATPTSQRASRTPSFLRRSQAADEISLLIAELTRVEKDGARWRVDAAVTAAAAEAASEREQDALDALEAYEDRDGKGGGGGGGGGGGAVSAPKIEYEMDEGEHCSPALKVPTPPSPTPPQTLPNHTLDARARAAE